MQAESQALILRLALRYKLTQPRDSEREARMPKKENKVMRFVVKFTHCLRCGHGWYPRMPKPRQCPKCKTAYFDVPREGR